MRYFLLILMPCLLAMACAASRPFPLAEDPIDKNDEMRLWRQAEAEQAVLEGSGIIYEDQELEDYLHQIARKLQPLEIQKDFTFKLRIIKDPHLNAFAFANGVIFIHTGLLTRVDNEAQLAALLAHEMAHCTKRHALRAYRGIKNHPRILLSLREAISGFGGLVDLLAVFGTPGCAAAVTGYSQIFETEADMVGLQLMIKAGYEPNETLRLFEHLKHEAETENLKEPFFFGTQRRLQRRIDNCKTFLANLNQSKQQGAKNDEIFLEGIHKVILLNAFLDLKAGRFNTALGGAQKYLTIRPNDARAYFLMGEIFRQNVGAGDRFKARVFYEKAISMDPSYPEPHKAIGLICFEEREWMLAKKHFESYLALSLQSWDRAYIQGYLQECHKKGAPS